MPVTIKPFDFADPLRISEKRLPHWRQEGCAYFVTCHLGDSLPIGMLRLWAEVRRNWLEHHPLPWSQEVTREYHERFTEAMERYLDAGAGSCALRKPACAQCVVDTLLHDDGKQYDLGSFVVMPNHIHLLVVPHSGVELSNTTETWERVSARHINRLLKRSGRLWGRDAYDHIVRNEKECRRIDKYIRINPVKANLRDDEFILGGGIDNWTFQAQSAS